VAREAVVAIGCCCCVVAKLRSLTDGFAGALSHLRSPVLIQEDLQTGIETHNLKKVKTIPALS
jgi:hypothetical protein